MSLIDKNHFNYWLPSLVNFQVILGSQHPFSLIFISCLFNFFSRMKRMNKVDVVVLEIQCDVTEEISLHSESFCFMGICKIGKLHLKWHWSTLKVRESFWAVELTNFEHPFDIGVRHLQTADLQTCRLADLQTCRLADLQTCRLADLQTCRLADLQTCRLADLQTFVTSTNHVTLDNKTNWKDYKLVLHWREQRVLWSVLHDRVDNTLRSLLYILRDKVAWHKIDFKKSDTCCE